MKKHAITFDQILLNMKLPTDYVGKKSINLTKLAKINQYFYTVPGFFVIKDDYNIDDLKQIIDVDYKICSVRSSGSVSAPGRMSTILNVTSSNLEESINLVKKSMTDERLLQYLEVKGITDFQSEIIIQQMIKPPRFVSGVFETVEVDQKLQTINAVYNRFGDSIMSGEVRHDDLLDVKEIENSYEKLFQKLSTISMIFKRHFYKLQEIEFVYDIDKDHLFLLQTRDIVLTKQEEVSNKYDLSDETKFELIGKGKNLLNRQSEGELSFDKDSCENKIFVYPSNEQLDFDNIKEMIKSKGLISFRGGELSHAARISREFNIPSIVNVSLKQQIDLTKTKYLIFDKDGFLYRRID